MHSRPPDATAAAMGDLLARFATLQLPAEPLARIRDEYLRGAAELWNGALQRLQPLAREAPAAEPPIADRRFAGRAWADHPAAALAARLYLLNADTLTRLADAVQGDARARARLRFAVQQWVAASSPGNVLGLNPEALSRALDTQGRSLADGLANLLRDLGKGQVSQTDDRAYEVGRNVAVTPGAVVFENTLFQLIEYAPLTPQVHERPMLFVPPFINKFYILDLQPENSFIRHTVEQGHRVFVVSWRNPDASLAHLGWDDYCELGPVTAIRTVQAITGVQRFNMLGFCVGGTILATALAVLAARGEHPARSLTLLTTLLDFSDTGVLDVFIDEAAVQLREATMGAQAPGGPGLLKGKDLAATFSFLRPNDLVWNYVVANYLKGETPPAFDLLHWNGDATNLPGPMYCWYLRHTYLQDELKQPDRLTVCGQKVDLGRIRAPVFVYGSREDHIVPWQAAWASLPVLTRRRTARGAPVRFVLGASGHIAGVINPPAKGKRSFWTNDRPAASAQAWLDGATEHAGSWWPTWSAWLATHGGRRVAAPAGPGNASHPPIEPAPGRYVRVPA